MSDQNNVPNGMLFDFSPEELASVPEIDPKFQGQPDWLEQQGCSVSVAQGSGFANVFVEEGGVTAMFDSGGHLKRITDR